MDSSQVSFLSKIIQIILKILIFGLALTILEFLGGLYVGAGHQSPTQEYISTWDYSSNKYNFMGIITLGHFFIWGFLGWILTLIHPYIAKKVSCAVKC